MANNRPAVWPTTVDNPFDPFTQWERWWTFDHKMGYQTCEKIAILARDAHELSDAESNDSLVNAINSLIELYEPFEVYQLAVEGKTKKFGFS